MSMPSSAAAHVESSYQSKLGVADRDPIRTSMPSAVRRSATRLPVLPLPPRTRIRLLMARHFTRDRVDYP